MTENEPRVETPTDEALAKFINSPKEFHLEMPLYLEINLINPMVSKLVYQNLGFTGIFDAYCIWCEKDTPFRNIQSGIGLSYVVWKKATGDDFSHAIFRCSRNQNHQYDIFYYRCEDYFVKIGQYPSVADFQIPQAQKYRAALGEESYKELTKGIGLAAHGVGIGSFVYLRRIFEDLIEEAHTKAVAEIKSTNTVEEPQKEILWEQGFKEVRMDEKIQMLEKHLPEFLVENKKLYSILSRGIHELSEEECLKYFESVKIGIEQILDEKIEKIQKKEKAEKARKAVQGLSQKLN